MVRPPYCDSTHGVTYNAGSRFDDSFHSSVRQESDPIALAALKLMRDGPCAAAVVSTVSMVVDRSLGRARAESGVSDAPLKLLVCAALV
jgi:hypothetical protein